MRAQAALVPRTCWHGEASLGRGGHTIGSTLDELWMPILMSGFIRGTEVIGMPPVVFDAAGNDGRAAGDRVFATRASRASTESLQAVLATYRQLDVVVCSNVLIGSLVPSSSDPSSSKCIRPIRWICAPCPLNSFSGGELFKVDDSVHQLRQVA